MRTEAQKRADAKYNKLNRVNFQVKMTRTELAEIESILAEVGLTKGQLIRRAVEQLKEGEK